MIDRTKQKNMGVDHCESPVVDAVFMEVPNLRPRKIAIFRALYLGDLLLAVPALRSIRTSFPDAEITLIGLPWAASFARRFSRYIDRFVEFVGYPGIQEVDADPEEYNAELEEQRAYGYDLVIQMHGSGRVSDEFALALNGKVTVGYYEDSPPAGLTVGMPYPEDEPEVLRNLGLARLLGCSKLDPELEFPLYNEDRGEAARLLRRLTRANRPWIGLHAGAKSPARHWPAEYFARVADHFAQRFNAQIILTGSSIDESTVRDVMTSINRIATDQSATCWINPCVRTLSGGQVTPQALLPVPHTGSSTPTCVQHVQPLNVAGQTSLGGLAALISELDLFISNDTGPAHIADAVDTLSVTIFGPTDPRRWAALDQSRHPIVRREVSCSPCEYSECPIDHRCLRWISPDRVIEVGEELLLNGAVACNA